jgi:hypothetical protein
MMMFDVFNGGPAVEDSGQSNAGAGIDRSEEEVAAH